MELLITDSATAAYKRAFDDHLWAETPVGPREQWSPQLASAVEVMLDTPQPMFVVWGEQTLFLFNAAYTQHLGSQWDGLLGRRLSELWAPIWPSVEPFLSAAYAGRAGIAEDVPLKLCPNGFEETRYFTFSYTPIRGLDGRVLGLTALCTDTTEKVAATKRVNAERNSTFRLFEEAPGFIAMVEGADHRFVFANGAYLKLVDRESVVGLTVNEAIPEVREQGFEAILNEVFTTGKRFVGNQMPISLNDVSSGEGRRRYLTFVYEPMRNDEGVITGIFVEGYDVTDKVLAEENLQRLQSEMIHVNRLSAMGAMAATLAHELNQPLAAVVNYMGAARRMLRGGSYPADLVEAIDAALQNTRRIGSTIRSVRLFTERGRGSHQRVSLAHNVREAGALAAAGGCAGVEISYSFSDDPVVSGDAVQIQQVILNLIRNACEAASAGERKHVLVAADILEGNGRVCVQDSGAGVPPDQLNTIFEAFHSTKLGGMGVGLAISRTIVEQHGGKVWAENDPAGGARFCFTLPLAA